MAEEGWQRMSARGGVAEEEEWQRRGGKGGVAEGGVAEVTPNILDSSY